MHDHPELDSTLTAVVDAALTAYEELTALGETVEDEWSYVNDLSAAHAADLRALADAEPDRRLEQPAVTAVAEAIAEIGLISDPHRAIDWLSTFPAIVELAVGPQPS